MGLDQYFYVDSSKEEYTEENFFDLKEDLGEEDIYLRKVNSIHGWVCLHGKEIIPGVGYVLTPTVFKSLVNLAKEVLRRKDLNFSKEILPTCSGFFFGSTEYNDWYYEDLADFIKDAENNIDLSETNTNEKIIYYASW